MTEITHEEARDYLPELLHGNLDAARRDALENHIASCGECASEMRVLQMVKDAPSFAPKIDAVKVASAISPYGAVPEARQRRKTVVWQLAAAAAAAVVLVVATVTPRGNETAPPATRRVASVPAARLPDTPRATPGVVETTKVPAPRRVEASPEIQLAVGLDGVSDAGVAQLVQELDGLDGLLSSDPENLGVGDPAAGPEGGS